MAIVFVKDYRPHAEAPSYLELVDALCEVLDGVEDHDIEGQVGSGPHVEKITEARRKAKPIWKPELT